MYGFYPVVYGFYPVVELCEEERFVFNTAGIGILPALYDYERVFDFNLTMWLF